MSEDVLREAAAGILAYRSHLSTCEIDQTDFCTCGMKEAADALRRALSSGLPAPEEGT